ncbi:MAG TPA: enolase C-terminal domain-like protein [Afipia sp.]
MNHPANILARTEADQPLRLKRMDLYPTAIPLIQPMKMAGVIIRDAENLFVRIESVDGTVGWGEAASAPTMTGETLWGMTTAANLIWDAIKDQDARFRPLLISRIQSAVYGNASAKSAIEMALLDLLGKKLNVGISELLGGRYRDTLEPMWLLGRATPEEDVAEARDKHANGYRFFKLKVGTKTIENDIRSVIGVREVLGMDVKLCADANGGLTTSSAARLIEATAAAKLFYLEQPLPADAVDAMAALQYLGIVPIGIDESVHARSDIETFAAHKAAAGVSLKLIKLGGMIETLNCAARAAELGLSINVAAKVSESSLASAAAAHVGSAIETFDWGISLTQIYLEHDPVLNPLCMMQGCVEVPRGVGLGIDIDEHALRHYRAPSPA